VTEKMTSQLFINKAIYYYYYIDNSDPESALATDGR